MVYMDVVMTLPVSAKVLYTVWLYDFLWHDVIHWLTATSYDKIEFIWLFWSITEKLFTGVLLSAL